MTDHPESPTENASVATTSDSCSDPSPTSNTTAAVHQEDGGITALEQQLATDCNSDLEAAELCSPSHPAPHLTPHSTPPASNAAPVQIPEPASSSASPSLATVSLQDLQAVAVVQTEDEHHIGQHRKRRRPAQGM